jgi:phage tail sheath gpL-like
MISFSNIPENLRVPLFFAELNNSQANTLQSGQKRALLIGQMTSAGAGVANVPVLAQGGTPDGNGQMADAVTLAGAGSMLALMAGKYRLNDSFGEVWYLPLADDGAAVAAVGGLLFTHVATAAGTLNLNVGDVLVQIAVTATMTLAQLATAMTAAINANVNLPVTAVVDTVTPNPDKVIITAKNKGLSENDIPLVLNAGGIQAGQQMPTALAITVTAMAGGTTNPSLTAGLAALGDKAFDGVIMPYYDATSLNSLQTFFNDQTGRWAWSQQIYGHGFTAMVGTVGTAQTLGLTRNDQHMTILAQNGSLTPHWLWAPAYSASALVALRADPGRPMQTLVINGVSAPGVTSQFLLSDQNTLLWSGISTFNVGDGGVVTLSKLITTYQENAFGQPDDSYLGIETMFQLMFLLQDLAIYVTSNYPRCKLAASMSRIPPGSFIVTPAQIKQDLIGHYSDLVNAGQAQDLADFAANIQVEQNAQNPNRVDVLYVPTVMNQLNVFAALVQFRQ